MNVRIYVYKRAYAGFQPQLDVCQTTIEVLIEDDGQIRTGV